MAQAPINKIINFSSVDGPGNRMAIFLQSCPFSCWYCHNPETIKTCIHCGDCVSTCPSDALHMIEGKVVWDEAKCTQCDTCIRICKYLSTPKILTLSAKELMKRVIEVKPFIKGVTVSGGECMNHPEFLREFFTLVKAENLGTLLDSNGFRRFADYPDLMQVCDGVMLDVKASDPRFHKQLTGSDNPMVLLNLKELNDSHKLQEVRIVILPNKPEENEKTVRTVCSVIEGKVPLKLLRYRPFGVRDEGLNQLGYGNTSLEEMNRCLDIAKSLNISNIEIK
jgi:pyruvate formate lyase activating enzyme